MSDFVPACVVCGRASERFLCGSERSGSGCLGELLRQLGDCAALAEELDTTISRQDKCGSASIGFVSNGGDEQPLPVNAGAMDAEGLLRDRMATWVRDLWETNRGTVPHCSVCHVEQDLHAEGPSPVERDWYEAVPVLRVDNTIVSLSRWLMRHPTWIALHPAAYELYDEITETIRLAWKAVDTAPGKVYIGPCSTVLNHWWGDDERPEGPAPACWQELYAREGDWEKRCPACLTIHDVRERQAMMGSAVEEQYVPVGVLVGLVRDRGDRLTAAMVRSLLRRRRIAAYVKLTPDDPGAGVTDAYDWFVRPWVPGKDAIDPRLFRVGEVLDAITNRYARQAA